MVPFSLQNRHVIDFLRNSSTGPSCAYKVAVKAQQQQQQQKQKQREIE
jgi:hypothetical protein